MEYVYPYQSAFVFSGQTQIGRRAFLGISAGIAFRLDDPRILSHIAPVWQTLNQAGASLKFLGEGARNPERPQFTDHCFTGDYPTPVTDKITEGPKQLSMLAEVG